MTRRPMRHLPLALLCMATFATPAAAQRIGRPSPSLLFVSSRAPARGDTIARTVRETEWKKGAMIGWGIGAGATLVAVAVHGCHGELKGPVCVPAVLLGSAVVGLVTAIPGALIGAQFTKRPKALADSTRSH